MRLSSRLQAIPASPTMAMMGRLASLRAAGKDVVSFALGEPDFPTPDHICARAKEAIDAGHTHYTPNRGVAQLRAAVRRKFHDDNELSYSDDEVIVSPGSKFCLFAGLAALLDPGDEVLVPLPAWVSTLPQILHMGAVPVPVPCRLEGDCHPAPHDLEAAITERTRAIVINSPNNPTGAVYSRQVLEAIGALAVERDIHIISDEIYEPLVYDDARHWSVAQVSPEVQARTLVVNGVAKAYAMTGWRIGYAAGPREWIAAMDCIQGHATSCPNSVAQWAALSALNGDDGPVEHMRREFDKRRLYMMGRLRSMPGMVCAEPRGAFYVFPSIAAFLGRRLGSQVLSTSEEFCTALLEEALVAAVPGSTFGVEGHIRLSYAASDLELERGLDRLEEFLGRLEG